MGYRLHACGQAKHPNGVFREIVAADYLVSNLINVSSRDEFNLGVDN